MSLATCPECDTEYHMRQERLDLIGCMYCSWDGEEKQRGPNRQEENRAANTETPIERNSVMSESTENPTPDTVTSDSSTRHPLGCLGGDCVGDLINERMGVVRHWVGGGSYAHDTLLQERGNPYLVESESIMAVSKHDPMDVSVQDGTIALDLSTGALSSDLSNSIHLELDVNGARRLATFLQTEAEILESYIQHATNQESWEGEQ